MIQEKLAFIAHALPRLIFEIMSTWFWIGAIRLALTLWKLEWGLDEIDLWFLLFGDCCLRWPFLLDGVFGTELGVWGRISCLLLLSIASKVSATLLTLFSILIWSSERYFRNLWLIILASRSRCSTVSLSTRSLSAAQSYMICCNSHLKPRSMIGLSLILFLHGLYTEHDSCELIYPKILISNLLAARTTRSGVDSTYNFSRTLVLINKSIQMNFLSNFHLI